MAPVKEKSKSRSSSQSSTSTMPKKSVSVSETQLLCDTCSEHVDKMIQCERCAKWICLVCANISEAKFNLLKDYDMNWFCITCRGPAIQAAQTDKLIVDRCKHYMTKAMEEIKKVKSELKGDVTSVNTRVNKLTEDVTDLKRLKDDISTIKDLREDLTSLKETLVEPNSNSSNVQELRKQLSMMESELERNKEETSREITQRDIRKTNIIAFNVPESKSDDPDNRKQHDRESFLQLCREFKLDDIEVIAVTRLQTSTNSESTDIETTKNQSEN